MAIGCTRIITNRQHSTKDLVEMIEKYKIKAVVLAARQVSDLVDYPLVNSERLPSLHSVLIGGSSLSNRTLVKMEQLAKSALLYFVYGTTESGAVTASFSTKQFGNTVGKLIPGTRVRIVSDEGVNLGPKDIGEIYIHNGHHQWLGYYGNPLQTQKTFDSESWFHSGDLGYFDENNNLYIVDRKKDIFKCKGFHYWPSQIEDVIAEMFRMCVLSVSMMNVLAMLPQPW
ncbi:uncharacterized protein Dwil_GK27620 [Drosophila willistoni]|uniref:AMP-dependent synthetase/ligase domain-containing protein n=1 Tax=Drosophila willistoni TaxID=7260 RepID=A0A0Q9X370_DROWI|nr:probable CoA ligase CCL7 [Drosophila willistoni]KRF98727.1 uncharacterized protein Dwil_GK27620 [Drosophila willistoni]